MTIDWNQFAGEYRKLEKVGDSLAGTITAIEIGEYMGKKYPELTFQAKDGSAFKFSASAAMLSRKLAEIQPVVGGYMAIVLTGFGEAKSNQSAPKIFDVAYNAPGEATPAPAPAAAAPAGSPSAADLI
jgi:hypothetical protein